MIAKILDDCGGYQYAIILDDIKTYSALVDIKNSLSSMLFYATGMRLGEDKIDNYFGAQMWDCLALLSAMDIQTPFAEKENTERFSTSGLDLPQYKEFV